jgi:hypothetical protein
VDFAKSDVIWIIAVASAALGFVELSRRQGEGEHLFAMTLALVVVVSALIWVALG